MEEISEEINFLRAPANFVITGATGSGKTRLLLKLLSEWPFKPKIGNILYFYNVWQPLFEDFLFTFPHIKFVQGLSGHEIKDNNNWTNDENSVNVCICDDLADEALKNEEFGRLFTVYGHHKNISNFFLTQNPFFKVKT